jgi:hypothetical protein
MSSSALIFLNTPYYPIHGKRRRFSSQIYAIPPPEMLLLIRKAGRKFWERANRLERMVWNGFG